MDMNKKSIHKRQRRVSWKSVIMKKGFSSQLIKISSIAIIGILVFRGTILFGQETDPFYLDFFHKGEKSFLAKNYKDAIKQLEIATFGRLGGTKLRAKAYIYLSLSHYYQEDLEKSEKYLNDAENLLGKGEFTSLGMSESVLSEFQKLMNYFKDREIQKEEDEGRLLKKENPEAKESQKKKEIDRINELEMKIKSGWQNSANYYELFDLYRKNDNLKDGRKTLKKLIKINRAEVRAYFLLGTTYYEERKYKEATNNFVKIFELTESYRIDQNVLGEAGAYLILSTHLQGDQKGALTMVAGLMNYMPEEKISSSSLNEKDKSILQSIIETYKHKPESDSNQ